MTTIFVFGLLGCSDANSRSVSQADGEWNLSLDPQAPLENASPAVAVIVSWQSGSRGPSDPILIEGEIPPASLTRYAEGETTDTLAERLIPSRSEGQANALILRSAQLLLVGQLYSVIAREGVLGKLVVGGDIGAGYLERVWPPRDSILATAQTIYCGNSAPRQRNTIALFPGGATAELHPGLDESGLAVGYCVRVVPQVSDGRVLQHPPRTEEYAFEPSPFRVGLEQSQLASEACFSPEIGIGPGCLKVENGRAIVRGPSAPTLWAVSSELGWRTLLLREDSSFAFPVFNGGSDLRVNATVFDLSGRSIESSVDISGILPTARVIINEAMADPSGPEPAEEWVELHNAGEGAAEMTGWTLRDQGSQVEIPPTRLEPGAFVLLVRGNYVGGVAADVLPAPGTALIRLSQLGKGGLLNSGESLSLVDALGQVVSTFPALSSGREGVSLARRNSLVLDGDSSGFASHGFPGSSPGEPNAVE